MPFDVATRDGVLTLTLDTPGSAVNIFNHATAHQLLDVLADVSPATTRAIVFETAKHESFINGVGLLLAHASQTLEDVERAAGPPWAAYRAVREALVPTIAVVQGNCFGCGVEFALNCDYRIAADTAETRFYMTELNDYLFVPLFGSTWNLPETVGLADAIDLLLWGARWDADTAGARGLVDEVIPHEALAVRRDAFVERVLTGTQRNQRRGVRAWATEDSQTMVRARRRITSLPEAYRPVYTAALELVAAGARQQTSFLDHQRAELRASAASALSPLGKAAYAFFYLRQMASERATGRRSGNGAALRISADLDGDGRARAFVDDLRRRKLPGVLFVDDGPGDVHLVSPQHDGDGIAVHAAVTRAPDGDVTVYAPGHASGGRLVELAVREPAVEGVPHLARALQRYGFEVARTSVTDRLVSNVLLVAYLAPLVRAVECGVDSAVINGTLRELGFVRLPSDVVGGLGAASVAAEVATALGRTSHDVETALGGLATAGCAERERAGAVVDALCVSLLDAVLHVRTRREVRDPTIVDLIARELFDFPRHLCSLSTWLKTALVTRAVEQDLGGLVTDEALAAAHAFVAAGRELYR